MRVEFVMDEAYLREFHEEMVATKLPRWRLHERVANGSLAVGLVLLAWALWSDRVDAFGLAIVVGLVGSGMSWRLRRRRERWLAYQRRLPTFGARVVVDVGEGELVQTSDRSTDVLAIRRGEIVESPRGWFVTYDVVHLGTEPTDDTVHTQRASAYLPNRGFEAGFTREAFVEALDWSFAIQRR